MTWLWVLIPAVLLLLLFGGGKQLAKLPRTGEAAHWIYRPHVMGKDDYECSRCHARFSRESPACPRCGIRMSGKTVKDEAEWFDEEEELDMMTEDD